MRVERNSGEGLHSSWRRNSAVMAVTRLALACPSFSVAPVLAIVCMVAGAGNGNSTPLESLLNQSQPGRVASTSTKEANSV